MDDSTQKFTPPKHTIFGDPFIQEQHNDGEDHNLRPSDIGKVIVLLQFSMLYELMKSLRSTVYIRRKG